MEWRFVVEHEIIIKRKIIVMVSGTIFFCGAREHLGVVAQPDSWRQDGSFPGRTQMGAAAPWG